ncbi:uncharacterized protein BP5553_01489 [Venustampulla echinocandica]|uniref:Hydroxyneurosporene synthase (CrtC) n=1 Tax=Venustampulla echinocandica TaxID=2656787 RepID=A0A370U155_9HELO|nr:uncharacterized protein BP5553_01489 [Venustampulla echinocandica]RDL41510.1 hypothetical protein BP5553_01489 [Venustampulla echinocandica]
MNLMMKHFLALFVAITVSAITPLASLKRNDFASIKSIPSQVSTGNIVANFVSSQFGFDGPQLSAVNSTSFDWWYFDAVSPDLKTSIVVVFFTSLSSGFPFITPSPDVTSVAIFYSFTNGTVGAIGVPASGAVVSTVADGSQGYFKGVEATWVGAPDMSYYQVDVNAPALGVVGRLKLQTKAPAHYPCDPAQAGKAMEISPYMGWANAMPDATADADFKILGSRLNFDGIGYHDKNWSDQPFQNNVASWYWGHGRLGPYSIVWFDAIATDGTEYVSGYAAKNGNIISTTCAPAALKVRPINSPYPPFIHTPAPDAFSIVLDMGAEGVLSVNLTMEMTIVDVPGMYNRWTGSMVGSVNGGTLMTAGVAMLEQFKMLP